MPSDWIEQQRCRLAEGQKQIDEMKTRLEIKEIEPFGGNEPPTPMTPERLQKRRYWLVIALTVYNCFALIRGFQDLATWPSSAFLMLPKEQVKVYHDAAGTEEYGVTVPLKEFPYDLQLVQSHRTDLLWVGAVNLVLLVAILQSYRQESRLKRKSVQQESTA